MAPRTTLVSIVFENLSPQRTRDHEKTLNSIRVNSESIWKEIDESNLQLKNFLNTEVEDDKESSLISEKRIKCYGFDALQFEVSLK
jgi:hypothetical protein